MVSNIAGKHVVVIVTSWWVWSTPQEERSGCECQRVVGVEHTTSHHNVERERRREGEGRAAYPIPDGEGKNAVFVATSVDVEHACVPSLHRVACLANNIVDVRLDVGRVVCVEKIHLFVLLGLGRRWDLVVPRWDLGEHLWAESHAEAKASVRHCPEHVVDDTCGRSDGNE